MLNSFASTVRCCVLSIMGTVGTHSFHSPSAQLAANRTLALFHSARALKSKEYRQQRVPKTRTQRERARAQSEDATRCLLQLRSKQSIWQAGYDRVVCSKV